MESLLFDAFVPAAYRHDPCGRWKASSAEKWLMFLARHLERKIASPDLAWWRLQEAAPHVSFVIAVAAAVGVTVGLAIGFAFGLAFGIVAGLAVGAGAGAAIRLVSGAELNKPARGVRISVAGLTVGITWGLGFGAATWLAFGIVAGIAVGVAFAVAAGVAVGTAGVPGDLTGVTSPGRELARDRQFALLVMIASGLACGLEAGVIAGSATGLVGGVEAGILIALAFGILAGLLGGFARNSDTAWPSYMLVRGLLAFHHDLPWSLMSFLADAHRRGVLRQAGAVYQFRHIELQHRLANRDADKKQANSPATAATEADG